MFGRNLDLDDEDFLSLIERDIKDFATQSHGDRVLIFPPVNNFRRFLIHKTCEELATHHNIATFSIGQGPERRTVVCSKSQLINRESLLESQTASYRKSYAADKSKLEKDTLNSRNHDWDAFRKRRPKIEQKSWRMGVESNRSNVPPPPSQQQQRTRTTSGGNNGGNVASGGGSSVELYRPPPLRKVMLQQTPSDEDCGDKNTTEETFVGISGAQAKSVVGASDSVTENQVPQKSDQCPTKNSSETSAIVNQNRSIPRQRERRPDRAVYIPRARRSQTTPPSTLSCANQVSATEVPNVSPPQSKQQPQQLCYKSVISPQSPTSSDCDATTTNNHLVQQKSLDEVCLGVDTKNTTDCDLEPNKNCTEKATEEEIVAVCEGDAKQGVTDNEESMSRKSREKNQGGKKGLRIEDDLVNGGPVENKEDKEEREFRRASQEINRSNRRIIKQTFNSSVLEITNPQKSEEKTKEDAEKTRTIDPENDDWDSMYDDNGDCLNPNLIKELTSAVGKVKIEQPKTDYRLYLSKQDILSEEEFPHVLEVSNFPAEFKTQDLIMIFSAYKESGFEIKWVDDTHCLAVFSSSKIAAEILATSHPFVSLKPLAEATVESRSKAKKCSNSLQPYRPRPETCAALARRLVTGALGVRLKTTREELENERRVLRAAKERKLLAAKQRDEVWDS